MFNKNCLVGVDPTRNEEKRREEKNKGGEKKTSGSRSRRVIFKG